MLYHSQTLKILYYVKYTSHKGLHIAQLCLNEVPRTKKYIKAEHRLVVTSGWEKDNEEQLLKGYRVGGVLKIF